MKLGVTRLEMEACCRAKCQSLREGRASIHAVLSRIP